MKTTLILVIPSFLAFYGFSSLKDNAGRGGDWYFIRIKDRPLPFMRWTKIEDAQMKQAQNELLNEYQAAMQINNRQMADELAKIITPAEVATEALNNHILLKQSAKTGISGTPEELEKMIKQYFPQNPGEGMLYMMRIFGYDANQEEAFVQDQIYRMTIDKARFLHRMQAKASLYELWQQFQLVEEKVQLSYVHFDSANYLEKVVLSDSDITTFFSENQEKFRVPDQIRYEYLAIQKATLINDAVCSDSEALAYYEQNLETEFKKEKEVQVRHIMLPFNPDDTEETLKQIADRMTDLYTTLTVHGADMADLADRFSADPANERVETDGEGNETRTRQGGLLPTYWSAKSPAANRYGQTVVNEALSMEKDAISKPIKGERGYHILRVEDVIPERIMSFEESRATATQAVKRSKGEKEFEVKKSRIYEVFEQTTTLSGLAGQLDMPVKETPLVEHNAMFIPGIGNVSQFQNRIAELREGEISDLLESPSLLAVMKIKEKKPTHIPELATIRDRVEMDIKQIKSVEMARQAAEDFLKSAGSPESVKASAEKLALTLETPEAFTHSSPPVTLTGIQNFSQLTLSTPAAKVRLSEISRGESLPTGFVVWVIENRIEPDKAKFLEQLPALRREVVSGKQRTILNENLADMRKASRFEINPQYLGLKD